MGSIWICDNKSEWAFERGKRKIKPYQGLREREISKTKRKPKLYSIIVTPNYRMSHQSTLHFIYKIIKTGKTDLVSSEFASL